MAKRVFKKEKIKEIVKNIAEDFRFSNEINDYALLFYKADKDGEIRGEDIDKMIEYLKTGLSEIQTEFQNLSWRKEYLENNPSADEVQLIDTLQKIESEYLTLLDFLQK